MFSRKLSGISWAVAIRSALTGFSSVAAASSTAARTA